MWLHQQQVFESVTAGRHVLVATGTGSGKTESFLYPIVDDLLRQRDRGVREGLTAILVYPMNALINSQTIEFKTYKENYEKSTGRSFPITSVNTRVRKGRRRERACGKTRPRSC